MSHTISKSFPTIITSNIQYSGEELNTEGCGITICQGTAMNDIIADIYEQLCSEETTCLIKVSEDDECCNYLQGKLISSDDSISMEVVTTEDEDGNSCETLDLTWVQEEPEWEALTLDGSVTNYGSDNRTAQIRKWANGRVQIRGRVQVTSFATGDKLTADLDAAYIPSQGEVRSVNVNNSGTYYPGEILITNTGEFRLYAGTTGTVFLGIFIEYDIN